MRRKARQKKYFISAANKDWLITVFHRIKILNPSEKKITSQRKEIPLKLTELF